jgi:antitoxin component of RelBE/YafQ-DinJ toxin-antitoxin module
VGLPIVSEVDEHKEDARGIADQCNMRKEASLPVRLDTDLSRRLSRAAENLGLTRSALIWMLVKSFVDEIEAAGGKITFPLHWEKRESCARKVAETGEGYAGKALADREQGKKISTTKHAKHAKVGPG